MNKLTFFFINQFFLCCLIVKFNTSNSDLFGTLVFGTIIWLVIIKRAIVALKPILTEV